MASVITDGYFLIGSDRSAYTESIEPSWDLDIQESRPFNSTSVKKDPGLYNNSFTWTVVDDASRTITQYLDSVKGTKVAFEIRHSDDAVSATNPKWTGNVIVPPTMGAVTQGDVNRFTVNFEVDGAVTMATS